MPGAGKQGAIIEPACQRKVGWHFWSFLVVHEAKMLCVTPAVPVIKSVGRPLPDPRSLRTQMPLSDAR